MAKLIDTTMLNYFKQQLDKIFANKVDKVSGKGLSTNDYTTTEKNKLGGIASGAQVNVLEGVKVNGTALTATSKVVDVTVPTKVSQLTNDSSYVTSTSMNSTLGSYAKKTDISTMFKYKGSVDSYAKLPTSGQSVGDSYNVASADSSHGVKAGDNVVWNGSAWDVLSGTVDLSGYMDKASYTIATSSDIDTIFSS